MKLNGKFAVRKIGTDFFAIPLGKNTTGGMIKLNDSGAFLFEKLISGSDEKALAELLAAEYGLDKNEAITDVSEFIEKMRGAGVLD